MRQGKWGMRMDTREMEMGNGQKGMGNKEWTKLTKGND